MIFVDGQIEKEIPLRNNKWILIDATLPYRRWHGYDCQHIKYELLSVEEFLVRMKKEESYWTEKAVESGDDKYAGLLYAPWIHDDVIEDTTEKLESVFYLLAFENKDKYQIYVIYLVYTKENAFLCAELPATRYVFSKARESKTIPERNCTDYL